MKIERKKRIKIIVLCMLAVLVVFVAVCACVPFLRHRVLRVPIKTEVLLLQPDEISVYIGGAEYALTESQKSFLYESMKYLLQDIKKCALLPSDKSCQLSQTRIEFSYKDAYRYVGSISSKPTSFEDPLIFSKLSFGGLGSEKETYTALTPYKCGRFYNLDGMVTKLLLGERIEVLLIKMLTNAEEVVQSDSVVESDLFPAKPDSVVLCRDGKTIELSEEQANAVYEQLIASFPPKYTVNWASVYNWEYGLERISQSLCVELRYHKRQKYTPSENSTSESSETRLFDAIYRNEEYDALLFVVEPQETDCALKMGTYLNNSYYVATMDRYPFSADYNFNTLITALWDDASSKQ